FETRLAGHEIRIGQFRSRLEDAWLDTRVEHGGDPARINERRRNRGVDIDERVEVVVGHHLVEDALQVLNAQRVMSLVLGVERIGVGAERASQPLAFAGKSLRGKKILDAAELRIAALPEIEIESISRFIAALLAGDHAQVDAARAAGQRLRIAGDRRQVVDRLYSARDRRWKNPGEKARLIGGHDFGDGGAEINRIDERSTEALHVGKRLVADADVVAVGNGRL